MRWIPAALIAVRVSLGPVLLLVAVSAEMPAAVVAILAAAMLSDLFDGIVARRLGIATARLREADSFADAWFFLWVAASAWLAAPEVIRAYWLPIAIEIVLQLGAYTHDLIRYRRIASLHAYSAKVWGFSLYVAAAFLIAYHNGAMIWVAFGFGILSAIDATAIKIILPGWHHDVLSFVHAWRQKSSSMPTSP